MSHNELAVLDAMTDDMLAEVAQEIADNLSTVADAEIEWLEPNEGKWWTMRAHAAIVGRRLVMWTDTDEGQDDFEVQDLDDVSDIEDALGEHLEDIAAGVGTTTRNLEVRGVRSICDAHAK